MSPSARPVLPPWPEEEPTVAGVCPLDPTATRPGSLTTLDEWGVAWSPVPGPSGQVLAGRVTTGDLEGLWQDLARTFPTHGLWPIIDEGVQGRMGYSDPDLHVPSDATEVLRDLMAGCASEEPDAEAWETEFAGLCSDQRRGRPGAWYPASAGRGQALVVVPVTRPADVPAALGWDGAANLDTTAAQLSAVLRSWEDRFGALLMIMGADTMSLQVAFPPNDMAAMELAAREHFAFCPDNIWQGAGSLEAYLPSIPRLGWGFWWD